MGKEREKALNVFFIFVTRPQVEFESALLTHYFSNPSCVVKHQLSQYVCVLHVVMDNVCV